jgi:hypothetical protein
MWVIFLNVDCLHSTRSPQAGPAVAYTPELLGMCNATFQRCSTSAALCRCTGWGDAAVLMTQLMGSTKKVSFLLNLLHAVAADPGQHLHWITSHRPQIHSWQSRVPFLRNFVHAVATDPGQHLHLITSYHISHRSTLGNHMPSCKHLQQAVGVVCSDNGLKSD